MTSKLMILVLVSGLLICSGLDAAEMKQSGFLSDYSGMKPGPKDGADWVFIKQGINFLQYNKIMVDQVTFFLKDNAKYKGIQPDDIKELTQAFENAVREHIGKHFELTDQPGPNVLRIRVAITDLSPSKPGASAVSTILPIGLGLSVIKKTFTGKHTGVGETSMEMEVLDSTTNERLAAAIDEYSGKKLSGLKKWGSAEEAFNFWAEKIRKRLDEYKERKQQNH